MPKALDSLSFRTASVLACAVAAVALALHAPPARADASLKCTMDFTMEGWSAFYQTAKGQGVIHCSNGRSMRVKLQAKGGGLTVGKSVESGHGEFSSVSSIEETLGAYARAEAQAGALKSAQGELLTKGEVSLALKAQGRGWELGVSFGEFKIER
jgi:hypothetical protein